MSRQSGIRYDSPNLYLHGYPSTGGYSSSQRPASAGVGRPRASYNRNSTSAAYWNIYGNLGFNKPEVTTNAKDSAPLQSIPLIPNVSKPSGNSTNSSATQNLYQTIQKFDTELNEKSSALKQNLDPNGTTPSLPSAISTPVNTIPHYARPKSARRQDYAMTETNNTFANLKLASANTPVLNTGESNATTTTTTDALPQALNGAPITSKSKVIISIPRVTNQGPTPNHIANTWDSFKMPTNTNTETLKQDESTRPSTASTRLKQVISESHKYNQVENVVAVELTSAPSDFHDEKLLLERNDFEDMDGKEWGHPEISVTTASASIDNLTNQNNRSIDSYIDDNIEVGLSTLPNQFCSKREAVELKKLILMGNNVNGGFVPSSSSVMDMYMVGKVIGIGSYGKVRAAWHRLTCAKVAIKTYDKSKMKDPSHWKRVYSEIRIMEQVSHPRIARLFEAVETPKRMHLIMECFDGGNLCNYVKAKKKLPEEESKKIFFQILQAIVYLHSCGFTHRDIKLENVLFTLPSRDIKLIDFGFAAVVQPDKGLKVFCGTPSYMAPEIVKRQEYDGKATDMWSLGILLYALLCGSFPFRAKTYPDLYRRIARGTFTIPEELSGQVKDLLKSLLQVDITQRISSMSAIRHSWLHSQYTHAVDLNELRRNTPILISDQPSDDIDEAVVDELLKYGIPKDEIIRVIATKTHSAISTLYYLLLDNILTKRKALGISVVNKTTNMNNSKLKNGLTLTSANPLPSGPPPIAGTTLRSNGIPKYDILAGPNSGQIPQAIPTNPIGILQQMDMNHNIDGIGIHSRRPRSAAATRRSRKLYS